MSRNRSHCSNWYSPTRPSYLASPATSVSRDRLVVAAVAQSCCDLVAGGSEVVVVAAVFGAEVKGSSLRV